MGDFRAFLLFSFFPLNFMPVIYNSHLLSKSPKCWLVALVPWWNMSTNVLQSFPSSTQSPRRLQGFEGQ